MEKWLLRFIMKDKQLIKNDDFGGFIVSKNVFLNSKIKYSFREKSNKNQLNGWTILSEKDDISYISNPKNFVIINMETLLNIAPVFYEIFYLPYDTELLWIYEEKVHIGFHDLKSERVININTLLND